MKKLLVFAFAALLLVSYSVPAMADVQLYGRVYFDTAWLKSDKETANLAGLGTRSANQPGNLTGSQTLLFAGDSASAYNATTVFDDSDLVFGLDTTISRFGARFSSGKVSGLVEMRPYAGSQARHWYGAYDFGSFELLLGKWWDPLFFMSEAPMNLFGGGIVYGVNPSGDGVGRPAQARLKFELPNKLGQWYISFQENYGTLTGTGTGATDIDYTIPKITTSLRLNFGQFSIAPYGLYQTFEEVARVGTTETSYDIDSWALGLSGNAKFGPFYLGGNIWTAENPQNAAGGAVTAAYSWGWPARFLRGNIVDTDAWGFQAVAKFKFNDMVSIEMGYQGTQMEREAATAGNPKDENEFYQFDIVLPIVIAKGFILYPTFAIFDEKDVRIDNVTTDEGQHTMYGFVWELNF